MSELGHIERTVHASDDDKDAGIVRFFIKRGRVIRVAFIRLITPKPKGENSKK